MVLTFELTDCRCTRPRTDNNGKSVPKFVLGGSLQCCCHSHCCWCVTSPIWICHDTFTFWWATLYRSFRSYISEANKSLLLLFLLLTLIYLLHPPSRVFCDVHSVSQEWFFYVCLTLDIWSQEDWWLWAPSSWLATHCFYSSMGLRPLERAQSSHVMYLFPSVRTWTCII